MKIALLFNKVILRAGKRYPLTLSIVNERDCSEEVRPFIELEIEGKEALLKVLDPLKMAPRQKAIIKVELKVPEFEGKGVLRGVLEKNEKEIATFELPIAVTTSDRTLNVIFVWHHHQPPDYLPDGTFHSTWAFKHVYEGGFEGFGKKGPYRVHVELHEKHEKIRDVDNLSPSLLDQWSIAISEGYKTGEELVKKDDFRIKEIKDTLIRYKRLIKEGKIEPLVTTYAHSIQGFLLKFPKSQYVQSFIRRLIKWEWEQGLEIVKEVLGVRPVGGWTPEMFWDMELIDIYKELGIKYTILCEQHFARSSGDKGSIYEPYTLVNPFTNSSITAFFRDMELSNWLSMKAECSSKEEAVRSAREFVLALYDRYRKAEGDVCVIALNGENWMTVPYAKKYSASLLDKVWEFIENSEGVLKTVTFSEYLRTVRRKRVLNYVPYGSWINLSDEQWTAHGKIKLWKYSLERLKWVAAYYNSLREEEREKMLRDERTPLFKAFKAAAIALDSDYYWYGELKEKQQVIREWADEAYRIALEQLRKVRIVSFSKTKDTIIVTLENELSHPVRVVLRSIGDDDNELMMLTITLTPHAQEKAHIPVRGLKRVILSIPPINLSSIEVRAS